MTTVNRGHMKTLNYITRLFFNLSKMMQLGQAKNTKKAFKFIG